MRVYVEINLTEKIPLSPNPQDLEIKESSNVKESMRWNGRVFVKGDGNEGYEIRIDDGSNPVGRAGKYHPPLGDGAF